MVFNHDFVCSRIMVFLMAFSLEKSLDFCGFAASKSVTAELDFPLLWKPLNFLYYLSEQTVSVHIGTKQ